MRMVLFRNPNIPAKELRDLFVKSFPGNVTAVKLEGDVLKSNDQNVADMLKEVGATNQ